MLNSNLKDGIYRISFHQVKRLNTLIADSLRDELKQIVGTPGREVVLSLEGINFIDSSGFQSIMDIVEYANLMGSHFRISDVSQDVYELLRLMKLSFVFEISPQKVRSFSGLA